MGSETFWGACGISDRARRERISAKRHAEQERSVNSPLQRRHCANHADRPGYAVCMACGKVVCQECATRWDGINYCVGCLAERRLGARRRSSALRWVALALVTTGLFYAAGRVMVFSAAVLAGFHRDLGVWDITCGFRHGRPAGRSTSSKSFRTCFLVVPWMRRSFGQTRRQRRSPAFPFPVWLSKAPARGYH